MADAGFWIPDTGWNCRSTWQVDHSGWENTCQIPQYFLITGSFFAFQKKNKQKYWKSGVPSHKSKQKGYE
jgi:hypothetical protein